MRARLNEPETRTRFSGVVFLAASRSRGAARVENPAGGVQAIHALSLNASYGRRVMLAYTFTRRESCEYLGGTVGNGQRDR